MRVLYLLMLLAVPVHHAFAQQKDVDKKLKGFDEFVARTMTDWKVQGLAVAVVYKNNVVLTKGYGYRDAEKKLPVTPETLFAIGSCTKAFTAAGVCLLQEEGIVDLDKPVREYMPDFKLHDDYVSENMTPRDLLCHRSGLPRHDFVWYGSPATRQQLYERLRYLEPSRPFRAAYQYQNLMFMTAGCLIERKSNQTWEVFTQQRLLDPLAMTQTNFTTASMQAAADHATGYADQNGRVAPMPYMNIDAVGPAGSINSTAGDMSHWLLALVNGGSYKSKKILSANTLQQIQTPLIVSNATTPYSEGFYTLYGLGWNITSYRGHVRVDHGGNIDGFSAMTCFMPKDSIGVVVLVNMNGSPLPAIVRNNVLDRMLSLPEVDWNKRLLDERNKNRELQEKVRQDEDDSHRVKGTRPSHPLASFAGTYEHAAYGIIEVKITGDSIAANIHGLHTKLEHYHYDIFRTVNTRYFDRLKLSFVSNVYGEINDLHVKLEPTVDDIVFTRTTPTLDIPSATLTAFAGEYDFGGQVAKVYIKNEKALFLFVPGQPEYELTAVKQNEFKIKVLEGFNIKFEVDAKGAVTEMVAIQPNGTFRAKRK